VGRAPAEYIAASAALDHAVAQDVGDDIAVAAQQRLRRAHFRAQRQLALGQAIAAVFLELRLAAVLFGAARAERALVHLAAHTERAGCRELRGAERAGIRAVAAADADVLVVQYHTVFGAIEAVHRAHRHAGRVRAVH